MDETQTSCSENSALPVPAQQETAKLDHPGICARSGDLLHQAVLTFTRPKRPFVVSEPGYLSSRPGHTHRREAIRSTMLTATKINSLGTLASSTHSPSR